jgi:hypothetical protein
MTTLTSMEAALLFDIATSEFNELNGGNGTDPVIIDNAVWSGADFFNSVPKKSYSGVLNSLAKKGLVKVQEGSNEMRHGTNQDPSTCWITKEGFAVLQSNLKKESAMTTKTAPVAKSPVAPKSPAAKKESAMTTKTAPVAKSPVAKKVAPKLTPKAEMVRNASEMAAPKAPAKKTPAAKPAPKAPAKKVERAEALADTASIKVLVKENPKRGKNARRIFDLYLKSKTVGEWRLAMKKADLDLGYLHGDIRRGLISVK